MNNKLSKRNREDLIELSKIMRHEKIPPFDINEIGSQKFAKNKRLKGIYKDLDNSKRYNTVSPLDQTICNSMGMGIHLRMIGLTEPAWKMVRYTLLAKGCSEKFTRRIYDLLDKFPKLVFDVCWINSELYNRDLFKMWKPGWREYPGGATEFKFPGPAYFEEYKKDTPELEAA